MRKYIHKSINIFYYMICEPLYERYSTYVNSISNANHLSGFKSNPDYTYMLEHVSTEQGEEYLTCILSRTSITNDEIVEFCRLNDSFGNPNTVRYDRLSISLSPSTLRYMYHAHLILSHMKNIGNVNPDIIEVGGGYGGLCLSLHFFAPKYGVDIKSYTLCDLTPIIRLQEIYLTRVNSSLKIEFVDANTFGATITCVNMFLVSNYCFSEISKEIQESYRQLLFPKVAHGFMAWNNIPVYDFGFTTQIEAEIPKTGPMNKYVYF